MSDENRQTGRGFSKCVQNRALVTAGVELLRDIASMSTARPEAHQAGDAKLAAALDEALGRLQREKERSVDAWQKARLRARLLDGLVADVDRFVDRFPARYTF